MSASIGSRYRSTPIAVTPARRPLRSASGNRIDGEHAIANVASARATSQRADDSSVAIPATWFWASRNAEAIARSAVSGRFRLSAGRSQAASRPTLPFMRIQARGPPRATHVRFTRALRAPRAQRMSCGRRSSSAAFVRTGRAYGRLNAPGRYGPGPGPGPALDGRRDRLLRP